MTNALYAPTAMPSDFVIALARDVRLLILDVDGVLTTGYLDYDAQGEVVKSFYVQDGLGIQLLRQMGIPIAIISGRDSKVTAARAKDLKIDFLIQGAQDKGVALKQLMIDAQVTPQQCAYMGDDVIDLPMPETTTRPLQASMVRTAFTKLMSNVRVKSIKACASMVSTLSATFNIASSFKCVELFVIIMAVSITFLRHMHNGSGVLRGLLCAFSQSLLFLCLRSLTLALTLILTPYFCSPEST